jgi:O-antigen/teichoic acid export membrane protein
VIPLLLVGVGEMFSAMITPHLSNDWEVGHRERVSERLNLALKLFAIGSMAASLGVIFCSPIIFDWMLQGKYNAGLSVLPLTFVYSTWAGLAIIAHNYLWCAERARIAPASMAVALIVNVSLNLALLPRLGLLGAVISTGTAYGVWLLLIVSAAWRAGMQVHRGTVLLMIAPVALALSPWAAAAVLLAICFASLRGNLILDEAERLQLLATLRQYTARLERMLGRTPGSGE